MFSYKLIIKTQSKVHFLKIYNFLIFNFSKILNFNLIQKVTPEKIKNMYTILRSPFKYGRSKEQYDNIWLKKVLNFSLNGLKKRNLAYEQETLWPIFVLNSNFKGIDYKILKHEPIKFKILYK